MQRSPGMVRRYRSDARERSVLDPAGCLIQVCDDFARRRMARILVVDDDDSVRRSLRKTLEFLGHEVEEAVDGRAALEAYRAHPADLVITDVYMPDTDGIEGTIRLLMEFPDAKVIVMTGGGWVKREDMLADAKQLGASGSLPKPFTVEEVANTVRQVLAGRADEDPNRG